MKDFIRDIKTNKPKGKIRGKGLLAKYYSGLIIGMLYLSIN